MSDFPDPRTIVMILIALWAAVAIGRPLASARNEAILPLLGHCVPVIEGGVKTSQFLEHFMVCGIGLAVFVGIPGTIGVALLVYRS